MKPALFRLLGDLRLAASGALTAPLLLAITDGAVSVRGAALAGVLVTVWAALLCRPRSGIMQLAGAGAAAWVLTSVPTTETLVDTAALTVLWTCVALMVATYMLAGWAPPRPARRRMFVWAGRAAAAVAVLTGPTVAQLLVPGWEIARLIQAGCSLALFIGFAAGVMWLPFYLLKFVFGDADQVPAAQTDAAQR